MSRLAALAGLLCIAAPAVSAAAPPQLQLAIFLGGTALPADVQVSLQREVARIVAPAGIAVEWRRLADGPDERGFEQVVVARLGGCHADPAPPSGAKLSLAETSVSDGRVLPFTTVECGRIARMIGRAGAPALGRALGRVLAHELYHILAQTRNHRDGGISKPCFSPRDLTAPGFALDALSLSQMRPRPTLFASAAAAGGGR